MEIEPNPIRELMDIISADIYELSIQKGSAIPELQEMLDSPEYANIPLEDKEELRRDIWMRKIEYTFLIIYVIKFQMLSMIIKR